MNTSSDTTTSNKAFLPGDHLCSIYQNKEQQFSAVIPFIRDGIQNKQKCIYVLDDCSKVEFLSEFEKHDFPLSQYIDSKQLVLLTKNDTYIKNGTFDPNQVISLLHELVAASLQEGYPAIRTSGEMTWSLDNSAYNDLLINYESELNTAVPNSTIICLCEYNETRFDQKILTEAIRTHPKIILYGKYYENPYFYTPPEYMHKADSFAENAYKTIVNEIQGIQ